MSEHIDDLTIAMDSLVHYFGNPYQIWINFMKNLEKKISRNNPAWSRHGSQEKVFAIGYVIEFLKDSNALAKKIPQLKPEIYAMSRDIIPVEYCEQLDDNESTDVQNH